MTNLGTPDIRSSSVTRSAPVLDLSDIPLGEVETAADFGQCLDRLRQLAGPLSNREIEKLSKGHCGRTKVGHAIKGVRPRRDFLQHFLYACGVSADQQVPWFETWNRLAAEGVVAVSRESAIQQAAAIIDKARADAETIIGTAKAEAERVTQDNAGLVHQAEARRDAALKRADGLTQEIDRIHEGNLKRIRDAEDSRDAALERASELTVELDRMHESALKRIKDVEEDRDNAVIRAREMSFEINSMHGKIVELRDHLTSSTKEIATEIGVELENINRELSTLREQITKIGGDQSPPAENKNRKEQHRHIAMASDGAGSGPGDDDMWQSRAFFGADDKFAVPRVIGGPPDESGTGHD